MLTIERKNECTKMQSLFRERVRAIERGGIVSRLSRPTALLAWLALKARVPIEVDAPLFFNEKMRVLIGETISGGIASFGFAERALTSLMLDHLKSGQVFVDVGTHFGYEAMLAASLVGAKGRVIAFEPNPSILRITRHNLNRFRQIELREQGISDKNGTLYLNQNDRMTSAFVQLAAAGPVAVPVTTLDAAVVGPIDFLKVDVEGMESNVIRGAGNIIRGSKPLVVLEADMPTADGIPSQRAFELAKQMSELGYDAFNFDDKESLQIGPLGSFPVHHANLLFAPR